ncbi:MAG: hypothetical protein M0Q12_08105, partial [Synergistaceae bacterium]|nr:hypothetical protein [Synergistaceae bacterium]
MKTKIKSIQSLKMNVRLVLFPFIALLLVTCSNKIDEIEEVNLTIEKSSIVFDSPDAQETSVDIQTNSSLVHVDIPQEDQSWISA